MYAIVETGGEQVKVSPGEVVKVPRLKAEVGDNLVLDRVLLLFDNGRTKIGRPWVDGAHVEAKVLSHGRGKKIVVFKIKRRKDYRRKQGHRQGYSELLIGEVTAPKPS